MKKTENTPRLIAALEEAAASTAYQIQIRDYKTEIDIYPRKRDPRAEFTPEIYFNDTPYGDESASSFMVQTTSYGSIKLAEIDLVIAGLRAAADFAKTLTELVNEAAQ